MIKRIILLFAFSSAYLPLNIAFANNAKQPTSNNEPYSSGINVIQPWTDNATNDTNNTESSSKNIYILLSPGVGVSMSQYSITNTKNGNTPPGSTYDNTYNPDVQFMPSIGVGINYINYRFSMPMEFFFSYLVYDKKKDAYPKYTLPNKDSGTEVGTYNFDFSPQMLYGLRLKPGVMITQSLSAHIVVGFVGAAFQRRVILDQSAMDNLSLNQHNANTQGAVTQRFGLEGGLSMMYRITSNVSISIDVSYIHFFAGPLGTSGSTDLLTQTFKTSSSILNNLNEAYIAKNMQYNTTDHEQRIITATFGVQYYPFVN